MKGLGVPEKPPVGPVAAAVAVLKGKDVGSLPGLALGRLRRGPAVFRMDEFRYGFWTSSAREKPKILSQLG